MCAIFCNHLVTAAHTADFGFQDGAAGVGKGLARGDVGLFADDAFAMDFLHALFAIGDHPVTGQQAGADSALIANGDVVGKHPAQAVRIALISEKLGIYRNLDIVARGHVCSVDVNL